MRTKAELFDLLANVVHLFFGGLRLHDNQHRFTLETKYVGTAAPGCPVERSSMAYRSLQEDRTLSLPSRPSHGKPRPTRRLLMHKALCARTTGRPKLLGTATGSNVG